MIMLSGDEAISCGDPELGSAMEIWRRACRCRRDKMRLASHLMRDGRMFIKRSGKIIKKKKGILYFGIPYPRTVEFNIEQPDNQKYYSR